MRPLSLLLTVGRLVVPVRPLVPTLGLELLLGRALALAEPVRPDALFVVGRLVVAVPLIELPVRPPPDTLAPPWPLLERRELIEPPLLLCLTVAA